MKTILTTCALFLVLPWKLSGEINPRQHEVSSNNHETTIGNDTPTIFSTKNTKRPSTPNVETAHNQSSTTLHERTSEDHQTNKSSDKPTIFYTKNTDSVLIKTNVETTHSRSSTRLNKRASEGIQTSIKSDAATIFSSKSSDSPLEEKVETTHSRSSTRLHKRASEGIQTSMKSDEATSFSPKSSDSPLEQKVETTHSPNSTRLPKGTSEDRQTEIRSDKPTIFSPEHIKITLNPNGETTHSPSSTGMLNGTSKDHETTITGGDSTIFFLKHESTAEETKNAVSSKSPPETTKHHVTNMSQTELTHVIATSTEESKTISHLSSFLTQKNTDLITITPLQTKISAEVITTRDHHQTIHLKSTNKGPDMSTEGNITTRSAGNLSQPQTEISTNFQKTPNVITNQTGEEVQTTKTVTTKWSSVAQVKESTLTPILTITQTLDNGNGKKNDTDTHPLNTSSVTTGFSTSPTPSVKTEFRTPGTTATLDIPMTNETTTRDMTTERKLSSTHSKILTTQIDDTTTTSPKPPSTAVVPNPVPNGNKDTNTYNSGHIVASLIGGILLLMFIAFIVILVRNRQNKKKQMDNSDWAGPSPFIEDGINPNLPTIKEDEIVNRPESRRISLYSFLPQRLSKRMSMLNPTDEEIPLEDTQEGSTFRQFNTQRLNGKTTADQSETEEANSPPAEVPLVSKTPETVNIPPAPENNENSQATTNLDDETIPSPPAEVNGTTPTPFEDVDLNLPLDKKVESILPSDAVEIPSPPPLAPS